MELFYLALPDVETSRLRVAERVAHGGHDIPTKDIVRRFPRSLYNLLDVYATHVDLVRCFMNSGEEPTPVFQQTGAQRIVFDMTWMQHLTQEAKQ